jgi:hypothetical protein
MGLTIKILAFVLGVLFFAVVLRSVKQNTFRPRCAVLWLGMSLFLLSVPALEPLYKWFATSVLGIQDARHIIYIALIGFLLIYNLYLTAMVSRISNQIQHLISSLAILEGRNASARSGPDTPSPGQTAAGPDKLAEPLPDDRLGTPPSSHDHS